MGLGKPQLHAKVEVDSFSRFRNIKEEPQILRCFPWARPSPLSSGCDFMMGLGKPQLHAKVEVASFSRCRNIKGEPRNFKELP